MAEAPILHPAARAYRGVVTNPARWADWSPRKGDVIVCTPPKCGTTWTQTMVAMLLNGGPDLAEKTPVLSPWIDAELGGPEGEVAAGLAAQTGRRVLKTHTPADGFPVWDGVTVIAVYRHPLDAFFSLRKHYANTVEVEPDEPMLWPQPDSFRHFIDAPVDRQDFDRDKLAAMTLHYQQTALARRGADLTVFHYADMRRDGRRAVERMARAVGVAPAPALIDAVAAATSFGAMKAKAEEFAPLGGAGYWKDDAAFFDSGSAGKWEGRLSDAEIARYRARLEEQIPDAAARAWLEHGDGD